MDRDVWMMAAWMVEDHGANAPMAVEATLEAMERDDANERQVMLWCLVGRAVLELVRSQPTKHEAVTLAAAGSFATAIG